MSQGEKREKDNRGMTNVAREERKMYMNFKDNKEVVVKYYSRDISTGHLISNRLECEHEFKG